MNNWWKWALAGAVLGSLLTAFLVDRSFTKREQDWVAARDQAKAQHVLDSIALAAASAARAEAQRQRDAALAEAARLDQEGDQLAGQVRKAKAQLAAARTVRDSLDIAVVIIGQQDSVIGKRDSSITSLRVAIAAAADQARADLLALGIVTRDRDRLQHLVDTAPVGKPKPKLLGFLPMPKFVVGGGVVGDKDHIGLGLFAGPAFPL